MATFTFAGAPAHTTGELPAVGSQAPDFALTKTDLGTMKLSDLRGQRVVLNIFPSIDTSTCATSVRRFNQLASGLSNTTVLCISRDLPFAQKRFCGAEGIENVHCLSEFRDLDFSNRYGVGIAEGIVFAGLHARSVIVVDENGKVIHTELVADVSSEPNYDAALEVLK